MDEVWNIESAIISSYRSLSGIIVLLNTKHRIKISLKFIFLVIPTLIFGHFEGQFSVIKLSVSIFGQTTGYRIYTWSREPIKLPEFNIQCLVFHKIDYFIERS